MICENTARLQINMSALWTHSSLVWLRLRCAPAGFNPSILKAEHPCVDFVVLLVSTEAKTGRCCTRKVRRAGIDAGFIHAAADDLLNRLILPAVVTLPPHQTSVDTIIPDSLLLLLHNQAREARDSWPATLTITFLLKRAFIWRISVCRGELRSVSSASSCPSRGILSSWHPR